MNRQITFDDGLRFGAGFVVGGTFIWLGLLLIVALIGEIVGLGDGRSGEMVGGGNG
jgi:hypothetical protein